MDDGRLKEVLLTKAGLVYFKNLEEALLEWVLQVLRAFVNNATQGNCWL
jgi:hypothetical protein